MPFTFNGDWIPSEQKKKPKGSVKIRLEKRKQTTVTIVQNLPLSRADLKSLISQLKKSLGCGGAIKDDTIEIQGNHMDRVYHFLKDQGINAQCPPKKKL